MDVFQALSDKTRRKIIELLVANSKLSVAQINAKFSVSPPAISQHLKILQESELVVVEKNAQQRIYSVNSKTLKTVEDWAKLMSKMGESSNSFFGKLQRK